MTNPLAHIKPYSVTLSVTDLEGMAAWYEKTLGFQEVKRKMYPQFKTSLIFLELNGYRVELIKDENASPGVNHPDPPAHTAVTGVSQFCFQTDDLVGVQAQLEKNSIAIVYTFQNDDLGVKFLFIRDPEGNLIQFLQRL